MGTKKENPNDRQIRDAKSTRPRDFKKKNGRLEDEIQRESPKQVEGNVDEGAANDDPFDARSNNMHRKR